MALYEIRKQGKAKTEKVEHDKDMAVAWADEQTKETGAIYEVYEIKQVHMTSLVKEEVIDFW